MDLAGLEGWQWLFLVQGLPAVFIGLALLRYLPESPERASWLSPDEKSWLARELASDTARIGEPVSHNVLAVLRNPLVLQLGMIGFLTIGSMVTMALSAPLLLRDATGLAPTQIGWIVSTGGILGSACMLFVGWYSDRKGERFTTLMVSAVLMGSAFLLMAFATSSTVIVGAYLLYGLSWSSVTLSHISLWPDVLHVRLLAVGSAAINSISQTRRVHDALRLGLRPGCNRQLSVRVDRALRGNVAGVDSDVGVEEKSLACGELRANYMRYVRMPIEVESPEEFGYGNIRYNLSESSVADASLCSLGLTVPDLTLLYGEHRGSPALRALIVADQPELSAADVLITSGAANALFVVATALLAPGDHLVVVRPNYATNLETPRAIGCDISFIDLEFEHGFSLDSDKLEAAITPRTKIVSVTSPHNPSGVMLTADELRRLVALTQARGCQLLVDETYRDLSYEGALPLAASLGTHVISVSSLSKAYGVPGLRIGWLITRDPKLQTLFLAAKEQISICGSVIDEWVAEQMLARRHEILPTTLAGMRERLKLVAEWIEREPLLEWVRPKGGVVCFPRMRAEPSRRHGGFLQALAGRVRNLCRPGPLVRDVRPLLPSRLRLADPRSAHCGARVDIPGVARVAPALRLVLDTNVVLDWLLFELPGLEPLRAALREGRITILTHALISEELARVLEFPKLQRYITDSQALLGSYRAQTEATNLEPALLIDKECAATRVSRLPRSGRRQVSRVRPSLQGRGPGDQGQGAPEAEKEVAALRLQHLQRRGNAWRARTPE